MSCMTAHKCMHHKSGVQPIRRDMISRLKALFGGMDDRMRLCFDLIGEQIGKRR